MKKTKILVLMGGKSPEHEVSVISGRNVVENLDKDKYDVFPVVISKDGARWQLVSQSQLASLKDILEYKGTDKEVITRGKNQIESVDVFSGSADCVFIAMHGPFGEDGTIQGMLELAGIPYTGSGVLASSLGMDKIAFRKYLVNDKTITTPKCVIVEKGKKVIDVSKVLGKPPYFVKPSNQGSSVGSSIVKTTKDFKHSLDLAFKYGDRVLVDEYVKGIELTVSVLGNHRPRALPVVEIVPRVGKFFDYNSKYLESGAEEIVPARISKTLTKRVQDIAVRVHKILGCRGFSRVDFILKDSTEPYVLEINTIPGLTPMSLLPKAAKSAGITYSKLLDMIINYAKQKS